MNIWTDFALSYDRVIPEMNCYQKMETKILNHLRGQEVVVDAGCGTGLISQSLIDLGHTVYGFDNNEAMLARAYDRRQALTDETKRARWHITAGDVTTFPAGTPTNANGLVLNNVLFFVDAPALVFDQASTALSKGGVAIFTGPKRKPRNEFVYSSIIQDWKTDGKYSSDLEEAFEHHKGLSRRLATQEMKTFFEPEVLVEALKKFGFGEVLEASGEDYYGENFFVAMRRG